MAKSKIDEMMKNIRKKTGSIRYDQSTYGEIDGFISTGCYSLNAILSGDIYGGFPKARITAIAGQSSSGKSLIASMGIVGALKNNDVDICFYVDSEGGSLRGFLEGNGCPMDKVEHVLVKSVEDCTVKLMAIYDEIEEIQKESPDFRAMVVVDSWGAMTSDKNISDTLSKGKISQDMGLIAKTKNRLARLIMMPVIMTSTTTIILNHTYEDPSQLHPSKLKKMGGGSGLEYCAHSILQSSRSLDKSESKDDPYYTGNKLRFISTKNRVCQPFHETTLHISFSEGIKKYDGLLDFAKKFGFIIQHGAWYTIPAIDKDKKFRLSQIMESDEIWESFMSELNIKIGEEMKYGSKIEYEKNREDITIV